MSLYDAADAVATDFLAITYRNVREFDRTIARNAILDCLHSSAEPNFIAVICDNRLFRSDARRVIDKIAPHLLDLCGQTLESARA